MYGDITPSNLGLREFLSACETYGLSHDIKFNHKKSMMILINKYTCRGKPLATKV